MALAGVSGSLAGATGLGAAYVFGMVAPLFALATLWDRHGDRFATLLRPRTFTWSLGPLRRTISGTGLATGMLLVLVGGGMIWTGAAGEAMPAATGWQADVTLVLQRAGRAVTDALVGVPQWLVTAALLVVLLAVLRTTWRQLSPSHGPPTSDDDTAGPAPSVPAADCCHDTTDHLETPDVTVTK